MNPRAVPTPRPRPPAAADAGDEPRDARVVREILHSVGLKEGDYEPAVVQQFLMLAYRYAGGVLVDALAYADHAGRGASLEGDDVRLAIRSNATFYPQLSGREVILEMARNRNIIPLPKSNSTPGSISLPPDQDMLLRPNDQCLHQLKPTIDDVEETKNEGDDEICNPEATCNNEEKSGSNKQQLSKTISTKLNAMAARAARRRILNNRKSKKVQPLI